MRGVEITYGSLTRYFASSYSCASVPDSIVESSQCGYWHRIGRVARLETSQWWSCPGQSVGHPFGAHSDPSTGSRVDRARRCRMRNRMPSRWAEIGTKSSVKSLPGDGWGKKEVGLPMSRAKWPLLVTKSMWNTPCASLFLSLSGILVPKRERVVEYN